MYEPDFQAGLFDALPKDEQFLGKLEESAKELGAIEATIEGLEETVKQLRSRRHQIRTVEMIDLMDQCNMSSFTHNDIQYEKSSEINGSFPKKGDENYDVAIRYLRDNDYDGLLKTQLVVDFQKGEDRKAEEMMALLEIHCEPILQSTIHTMSLRALARKALADGKDINLPQLGLSVFNIIKSKAKKK